VSRRRVLILGLLLLASSVPSAVAAPTIAEYSAGFTANRGPRSIAAGPDGNLWVAQSGGTGGIARITTAGAVTEFTAGLPPGMNPVGIAAGPDGNMWFTLQADPGAIGRITPAGAITTFQTGLTANARPTGIAAGPDGAMWFTAAANPGRIGRITTSGGITEFAAGLLNDKDPTGIAAGPDGNMWFTLQKDPGAIGRITPAGAVTILDAGLSPSARPTGIAAGPDGAMWFTAIANPGRIGRITTSGGITEFTAGLLNDKDPTGIAAGPDGNMWLTQQRNPGAIARITPAGSVTVLQDGLTANAGPTGIVAGPDGRMWFTEMTDPGRVGAVTVGPTVGAAGVTTTPTSATVRAGVAPNSEPTTVRVEWGETPLRSESTADVGVSGGGAPQEVAAEITGLAPSTTYHYRVVATNATATAAGPEGTFTTAAANPLAPGNPLVPPPAAGEPEIGRSVGLAPSRGTVRVRVPGTSSFVALDALDAVPVGTIIDTRRGRVDLTSALPGGRTQTGAFWGGLFTVRQVRSSGVTRLVMPRATGCPAVRGRHSEDARRPRKRRPALWGKDDGGRFRTDGANSVATVRGTVWQTVESCHGTLTRVREGAVSVRDLRLGRTVLVRAGRSYLARRVR
jgi:streptogramin lyase